MTSFVLNLPKFILYSYLIIVVFCGTLNPYQFPYLASIIDIVNIFLIGAFFIFGLFMKREYAYSIYKVDLIILFVISLLTIPSIVLNELINSAHLFKHFYPIRIFFTYKIFSFIYHEFTLKRKKAISLYDFIDPLIAFSIVSALLSIIRYLPTTMGFLINDIWPIISNGEIQNQLLWGRLWGTMGGTNTAGNFFTLVSFLSLCAFYIDEKRKYIFPYLLFSLCVLLSLSFTSILSYVAGLAFIFKKKITIKVIFSSVFVLFTTLFFVNQNETLNQIAMKRIGANFSEENRRGSILPYNLQARIGYWKNFLELSNDKELHFLYGFGPGGVRMYKNNVRGINIRGNPESFYFRIYNESGLIGLTAIFGLLFYFYQRLYRLKKIKILQIDNIFISLIFFLIIIQSIANEPIYSNGVTQIFTFFLFYITVLPSKLKLNNNWQ